MRVRIKDTNEILEVDGAKLKENRLTFRRGIYSLTTIYDCDREARWAFDNLLRQGYIIIDKIHEEYKYGTF